MRIDFLGLEAFVAIAERGSFQRAARHLSLTETALSHRIRKLEADLGARLFVRTGRAVVLTPLGLELLPKAERALADLAAGWDGVRRSSREQAARLTIACLPSLAVAHLPAAIAALSATHPEVRVTVLDNSATEIADHVESGRAAFGVSMAMTRRWDLLVEPVVEEPFVLIGPRDHPLIAGGPVGWADLAGQALVRVSTRTGNRLLIDDAVGALNDTLDWRYEVQHLASAIGLVASGAALSVVPRLALAMAERAPIAAVPLERPTVSRTLGILARAGLPLSEPAERLKALLIARLRADG